MQRDKLTQQAELQTALLRTKSLQIDSAISGLAQTQAILIARDIKRIGDKTMDPYFEQRAVAISEEWGRPPKLKQSPQFVAWAHLVAAAEISRFVLNGDPRKVLLSAADLEKSQQYKDNFRAEALDLKEVELGGPAAVPLATLDKTQRVEAFKHDYFHI